MKRFLTVLLLTATAFGLFGCGPDPSPSPDPTPTPTETATETPVPLPLGSIVDYFGTKSNTIYVYEGSSPEAAWQIHNDYIRDGYIQRKIIAGGYYVGELLMFAEGEMRIIYSRNNYDYMDDLTKYETNNNGLILKEPLALGNTWQIDEGSDGAVVAEITDLEKEITIPYGTVKALEVTITFSNSDSFQREYYAKDIGFVKAETIVDGQVAVYTELSEILENSNFSRKINIFCPDFENEALASSEVEINFETNLDIPGFYEKAFKETETRVFSPDVKINSILVDKDESLVTVDLSKDFVTGMNAGVSLETLLLKSITATMCDFYGVDNLDLNIDGQNYESGHMLFSDGEYLKRPGLED